MGRAKVGDVALDLCCGSGDLAFLLSEKVGRGGKVSSISHFSRVCSPSSLQCYFTIFVVVV